MDKFGGRRDKKTDSRKVLLVLAAFLLCAGCFATLIAFGNGGAKWVVGVYVFGLTMAALTGWKSLKRNYRLWAAGLKTQSYQGPGFSPLEVAAISEVASDLSRSSGLANQFKSAEVIARYNSGAGGLTTFRSLASETVAASILDHISWFWVEELQAVVGCRFWADSSGSVTMLEAFTGGENTAHLDWTRVTFRSAPEGAARPRVPSLAPVISEPRWIYYRPDSF